MCAHTYVHVLGIRLGNNEDDNVLFCERDREEDDEDDLKKNERKRVNLLLCVTACFIDDFVLDEFKLEDVNSLVIVGLTIVLLPVDDTAIARDVDNDDGTIELY
jgi:hypothetical protein